MIGYINTDIITLDCEALVNPVNTVGVSGKGVALQVKRKYPEVYAAYRNVCNAGSLKVGGAFTYIRKKPVAHGEVDIVINLATKGNWRFPSKLAYIELCMQSLVAEINQHYISSLVMPRLGCGHGGLDWKDVEPIVLRHLNPIKNCSIFICHKEVNNE